MQSLHLAGELTIHNAAERKATMLTALEVADELDVVLAEVTELDTAGLQLLLLLRREAAQLGKSVRFSSPSRVVTDVLAIAQLGAEVAS